MPSEIQICQSPRLSDSITYWPRATISSRRRVAFRRRMRSEFRIGGVWGNADPIETALLKDKSRRSKPSGGQVPRFPFLIGLPSSRRTTASLPRQTRHSTTFRSDPVSAFGYKALMNVKLRANCQANQCGWFMIEEARLVVESPTRSLFRLKSINHDTVGTLHFEGETDP